MSEIRTISSIPKRKLIVRAMIRDIKNRLSYGDGHPKYAELIYINPNAVSMHYQGNSRKITGCALDGDWDLKVTARESLPKVRMIRARILSNLSWKESGLIDYCERKITAFGDSDGYTSSAELTERYNKLDRLISELRDGGSLSPQKERGGFREAGGILIHIDRNGNPIFGGSGCHRLTIAQALNLQSIPAMLGCIHKTAFNNKALERYRRVCTD